MEIRRCVSDLLASNMYIITENGNAIVIDPFRDTSPVSGLKVDLILLTHEHYDHISGVNLWKETTGAKVLCSSICAENIQDSRKNMAHLFEVFCQLQTWIKLEKLPDADENYTCSADERFEDKCSFKWQGHDFLLFGIPGHSAGSAGILLDRKWFFSGDSMMDGRPVELRFPGGSRKQWKEVTEPRLRLLPEKLTVCPGHFGMFFINRNQG